MHCCRRELSPDGSSPKYESKGILKKLFYMSDSCFTWSWSSCTPSMINISCLQCRLLLSNNIWVVNRWFMQCSTHPARCQWYGLSLLVVRRNLWFFSNCGIHYSKCNISTDMLFWSLKTKLEYYSASSLSSRFNWRHYIWSSNQWIGRWLR